MSGDRAALTAWLVDWVAERLGQDATVTVDVDRPLTELGLSSRHAVALAGDLTARTGRAVDPTTAWRLPTIRAIAEELTTDRTARHATTRPDSAGARGREPLAVVGLGCRLPGGVEGPDAFWDLLLHGRDALGTVPAGRWEQFVDGSDAERAILDALPRTGGFLDDVAAFDAEHFGISAAEARLMDPQQRILLEVVWEAIEHAGTSPESLRGTRTGVFVGASGSEYAHVTARTLGDLDVWTPTGGALSILANRLSYLLDLRGPSLTVDTACSSSLVAFHQACRSLDAADCDTAVVGGVNLLLSPAVTASFQLAGLLADDGRCKPFSADADGIVRAEGCSVVVLKRLADAQRDGDRVLALVRGSAVGSDGRSNGLMAPNPLAQQEVLAAAYADAGVDPATVDHVEAHGTGTLLGDPIEAGALGAVLGAGRDEDARLLIGSAKSNLGHLEAAAGLTGLVKSVLALHHDHVPPSLHADTVSPLVDRDEHRLRVVGSVTAWPRHDGIARAGVSAFGFGGTNAHVVLEEAPVRRDVPGTDAGSSVHVLAVSAPDADRAVTSLEELRSTLSDRSVDLHDAAAAAARRLGTGPARCAVVARDHDSLRDADLLEVGLDHPGARPVWVFGGHGSCWTGMGATLLREDPVFASALETVAGLVRDQSGLDVLSAVEDGASLTTMHDQQLAVFCVQVALAAAWRAQGVEPAAVVGVSMGEVAAAVAAGGLSLRDGVTVMVARTALVGAIDATGAGALAVVDAGAAEIAPFLAEHDVTVAVHASPAQCTVSGPAAAVEALSAVLEARGVDVWPVPGAFAAHTAAVEPHLDTLRDRLVGVRARRATVSSYATSHDDPRTTGRHDVEHWVRNVRRPVRLDRALEAALADGHRVFVEVSPHPTALRAVRATATAAGVDDAVVVGSLRRDHDDVLAFHRALAELRLRTGSAPAPVARGAWIDLPRTRWRHARYWHDAGAPAPRADRGALGVHVELPEGGRHLWTRPIGRRADLSALLLELVEAATREVGPPGSTVAGYLEHALPDTAESSELLVSATADGRVTVHVRTGEEWTPCASALMDAAGVRRRHPSTYPAPSGPDLRAELAALDPALGRARLDRWLAEQVGGVLGVQPEVLDRSTPLVSLGLDSLMVTRAANVVRTHLDVALPARLVLRGATLVDVVDHLAGELGLEPAPSSAPPPEAHAPATARAERSVLARDPSERLVADTWREVLGHDRIAVDVAFDRLGGCRRSMERVRELLVRRVDDVPDVEELMHHATVAAMADLVRPAFEGDGSLVRTLRPASGSGADVPALMLFHPAGGPTSVYQPLVDLLGPDVPVHGFERIDDASNVEERAEVYLPALRALQPRGPYRLMGWSFGGLLADAVAARLSATDEVQVVAMIDTVLPRPDVTTSDADQVLERFGRFARHVEQVYGVAISLPMEELAAAGGVEQLTLVRSALAGLGDLMPAGVLEHQITSYADARAAEHYRPRHSAVPRVLYRADADADDAVATALDPRYRRHDTDLGWRRYGTNLEVVPVPGDHVSMIDRPHVDVIARHLDRVLRGAALPTR